MISIVAHGIMGTAYRQVVVTDAGLEGDDNLHVLRDIRRQLSYEYEESTLMAGWAMQSAPAGIWVSIIERAFDANYSPAYVMVSFLIPKGKRLLLAALQRIEHSLIVNNAKYMNQSVLLYKPDWSFLSPLGDDIEGLMENVIVKESNGMEKKGDFAYWPGDMPSMLENMWDARFRMFELVFCGNKLLQADKEYVSIEEVVAVEVGASNQETASVPLQEVGLEPLQMPDADVQNFIVPLDPCVEAAEDLEKETIPYIKEDNEIDSNSEKTLNEEKKRKNNDFARNVLIILGVFLMVFLLIKYLDTDDDTCTEYENITTDCNSTKVKNDVSQSDEVIMTTNTNETKKEVSDSKKDDHVMESDDVDSKINITSSEKIFLCLTWDNVMDNGKLLYEKYYIADNDLKIRVDRIIQQSNKLGKTTYEICYYRSKEEKDCLSELENELQKWNRYYELLNSDTVELVPKFGLG